MKILVTGANGFLGSHVTELLLQAGHDVTALIRPAAKSPSWASRVKLCRIDLRAPNGLDDVVRDIDTVVHVAAATSGSEDMQFASTVGGTEKLLAAMARAGTRRLVLISSFVVYDWDRTTGTLDEASPVEDDIYPMGAYSIAKLWQENIVWKFAKENDCHVTVLRPGFIWGRDHAEIAGMGKRFGKIMAVIAPRNNLPLTHVANCADCIVKATAANLPSGTILNVIDTFKVSAWTYAGDYLSGAKIRAIRIPVPYVVGYGIARLATAWSTWRFGARGQLPALLSRRRFQSIYKPLKFSSAKLEKELHWNAPHNYVECLNQTFDPS